jgi:hypothetical protein
MKYAFTGAVIFEAHLRLLGASIKREMRVAYEYTPPWPYFDPETATEITGDEKLTIGLEILARPRADRGSKGEPYWTSANEFLSFGVFNHRVYDRLDELIDTDARIQDLERRQKANPGNPSLPNVL